MSGDKDEAIRAAFKPPMQSTPALDRLKLVGDAAGEVLGLCKEIVDLRAQLAEAELLIKAQESTLDQQRQIVKEAAEAQKDKELLDWLQDQKAYITSNAGKWVLQIPFYAGRYLREAYTEKSDLREAITYCKAKFDEAMKSPRGKTQ